MKNNSQKKTCKNNLRNLSSEKTRWAYYMQAIEPTSEAINNAFPDYHPQWVQLSQMCAISPAMFICLRQLLGLTQIQCAAYLRVGEASIRRWESGKARIPFAVFELMRLILDSVHFKFTHPDWDGWFVNEKGVLHSPDIGGKGFTPEQLVWSSMTRSEAALLRNDVASLQNQLGESIAENAHLRQLFLNNGVLNELVSMQDKINGLMDRIGTAQVIPFHSTGNEQLQEIAA